MRVESFGCGRSWSSTTTCTIKKTCTACVTKIPYLYSRKYSLKIRQVRPPFWRVFLTGISGRLTSTQNRHTHNPSPILRKKTRFYWKYWKGYCTRLLYKNNRGPPFFRRGSPLFFRTWPWKNTNRCLYDSCVDPHTKHVCTRFSCWQLVVPNGGIGRFQGGEWRLLMPRSIGLPEWNIEAFFSRVSCASRKGVAVTYHDYPSPPQPRGGKGSSQ